MSQHTSFSDALIRPAVRLLAALPPGVQRWLGGTPITVDGRHLTPEIQLGLRLLRFFPGADFMDHPLSQVREQLDAEASIFSAVEDIAHVSDFEIPTRSGHVRARRYADRPESEIEGTVVYFHGGGWVVGGLESTDPLCRFAAKNSPLEVISVDYRLAPEHPYPAGLEDAIDAYRWVRGERGQATVAVAGDSAGGNLSTVVCLATIDDAAGPPDFQLLLYPCTDLSTQSHSYQQFGEGFFLTAEQMEWYRAHYLSDQDQVFDPFVSPLLADSERLAKLPPTHIAVAGFDVLRDEGIAYAERLREAGVPVTLQDVEGAIHAFASITGASELCARALHESVNALAHGVREAA